MSQSVSGTPRSGKPTAGFSLTPMRESAISITRRGFGLTRLPHLWHGPLLPTRSQARADLAGVPGRHSPRANSYHHHLNTQSPRANAHHGRARRSVDSFSNLAYAEGRHSFHLLSISVGQILAVIVLVLLTEGQIARIAGTDLTITVSTISESTSKGCLGGPLGCPDYAQFKVTRGQASQQITLYAAQTEAQRMGGIHRTNLFGYTLTLITLQQKQVVLDVEIERNPSP